MIAEWGATLAVLGMGIAVARYAMYYRDIFRGITKPHPFTWFIWGLMNVIVWFAQTSSGAGAGAWVTGLVALACLSISAVALFKGEKVITRLDWFCFFSALLGIVLWRITNEPLVAVILVTLTDAIAYVPTYRKSFYKPYEETASSYSLAALRSVFAVLSLDSFALVNWLFPASLILTDGGFVVYLLIRRRQLKQKV